MYSRYNSVGDSVQRFFTRGRMPFTTAIVVITVLHFIVNFYTQGRLVVFGFAECLFPTLTPPFSTLPHYWTLLTYPVAETTPINCLFTCLWLWWIGGSLERSWGTAGFARFFVVLSLVTSLALWVGCNLLKIQYGLGGLVLPLVGLTTAWAAINPQEEILFYFILKLKAWVVAALTIAIMLFIDFGSVPALGLFALVNPFTGYIWVRGKFAYGLQGGFLPRKPVARRGPDLRLFDADRSPRKNVPLDDLKGTSRRGLTGVYQDWRQRKRLEKLWRDSGLSDSDEKKPKR